jgi:hypothetical protein
VDLQQSVQRSTSVLFTNSINGVYGSRTPFGGVVIGGPFFTGKPTVQILLSGATLNLPTRIRRLRVSVLEAPAARLSVPV